MNVSLTNDLRHFVRQKVASGDFPRKKPFCRRRCDASGKRNRPDAVPSRRR